MFINFSEDAKKVLIMSKKEMSELNHEYIGTEHLFLSILKNSLKYKKLLNQYNVDYDGFKKTLLNVSENCILIFI